MLTKQNLKELERLHNEPEAKAQALYKTVKDRVPKDVASVMIPVKNGFVIVVDRRAIWDINEHSIYIDIEHIFDPSDIMGAYLKQIKEILIRDAKKASEKL